MSQFVTVSVSATVSSCKRTQSHRHLLTAWLLCGCTYTVRLAHSHRRTTLGVSVCDSVIVIASVTVHV